MEHSITFGDVIGNCSCGAERRRIPHGILFIPTYSVRALQEEIHKWRERLEQDPHYIPILAVPPDSTPPVYINFDGHGTVEVIPLGEDKYKIIRKMLNDL